MERVKGRSKVCERETIHEGESERRGSIYLIGIPFYIAYLTYNFVVGPYFRRYPFTEVSETALSWMHGYVLMTRRGILRQV